MKIDILTLFPDLVDTVLSESIIGRARKTGALDIGIHNIRDFSIGNYNRVDDTPYGGGKGMLMMAPPVYDCYSDVIKSRGYTENDRIRTVYMSPKGRVLDNEKAVELSGYDGLVILCGHYEGIDQRVIDEIVDEEISIGDFVLTGGEIPACILADCVGRLCPGVLSADECFEEESIYGGLLEYPQYTRPYEFHGMTVPDVLISGHHGNIDKWRHEQALEMTKRLRPDLYEKYMTGGDQDKA